MLKKEIIQLELYFEQQQQIYLEHTVYNFSVLQKKEEKSTEITFWQQQKAPLKYIYLKHVIYSGLIKQNLKENQRE